MQKQKEQEMAQIQEQVRSAILHSWIYFFWLLIHFPPPQARAANAGALENMKSLAGMMMGDKPAAA